MIGSVISIVIIWILAIFLVIEAIGRFYVPVDLDAHVMLATSAFGIVANLVMLFVLGHGHSHGYGMEGHGHA